MSPFLLVPANDSQLNPSHCVDLCNSGQYLADLSTIAARLKRSVYPEGTGPAVNGLCSIFEFVKDPFNISGARASNAALISPFRLVYVRSKCVSFLNALIAGGTGPGVKVGFQLMRMSVRVSARGSRESMDSLMSPFRKLYQYDPWLRPRTESFSKPPMFFGIGPLSKLLPSRYNCVKVLLLDKMASMASLSDPSRLLC